MKNTILNNTIIILFASILAFSCSAPKSADDDSVKDGYLGMNVPKTFSYSTTKNIGLQLDARSIASTATIAEVYNANPHSKEGKRIGKFFISGGRIFTAALNVPSHLQEVWVVSRQTDGVTLSHQVPLFGSLATVDLSVIGEMASSIQSIGSGTPAPSCTTGCDEFVSGNGLSVTDGRTYCVPQGEVLTGDIHFSGQGGTIQVCGTMQVQNFNVNGNPSTLEILIGETGVLQANTLNINSRDALLVNHGVLQISGGLSFNYRFENYSETSLSPFNVNSNAGEFYNEGTLNVSGNFNNNNCVHNRGTINTTGSFNNNGNSELINECRIIANNDFHQNGIMEHLGYIRANNTVYIQQGGNGSSVLGSLSLISADRAFINRPLTGPTSGGYARLDIDSQIQVNGGGQVNGLIDLCVEEGQLINNGSIKNTVTFCEAFIPANECNPGSGSSPGEGDNGGDPGDDEFPDDPDRFFNNPFPADGVFGTLAYEDLWPSYGDFDMNDLVVGYHINEVTNQDNEIVDIEFTCVIRALGAGLDSGFGVEFPVSPSRVQMVEGVRYTENIIETLPNGAEANQSNATVIFWDNSAYEMGKFVNTENPMDHVQEDTLMIRITFDPPVTRDELGNAPYKPFIFVDNNRGLEVHLPGNAPTSLMDQSFFGLHDDDSDPSQNRFFVSRSNLNWAINIPETIPYPLERIEITDAYLKFREWAESGGEVYQDWYFDLPGYKVPSKLYIRP